ncbi:MAG: DNA repair protein RecN [Xanthomonadales bacterium]|nr:DNA repair protein RecN [Gammaproteobacteria bacterium]MBT8053188.1 DNA repair protein RecN [Gammaproteobacteria bacterium]NND57665.1 DNA repair protein RecN [Xanthomonadales bacterium]NNK50227.1 DNA repair protein RecN [Xanthomonadales bacterium]
MLNFLQIRNYAIVESLDLEFTRGFTCVTGETGAGKSILVDALGLLCGDRADTSAIRSGATQAELSAEFEIAGDSPAHHWLQDAELDHGSTCLLRRMINENGRSRAWINGTAVTLQQLAGLGERLVEIHGQNEHILLVRSEEQFRLLDNNGGYRKDLEQVAARFAAWSVLEQEKQELLDETPLDAGDMELMQYQIQELESTMLTADQFIAMEAEHRLLARGGELLEVLEQSIEALESDRSGAGPVLHGVLTRLEAHASLDTEIAGAAELVRSAAINCDEALNGLQSARSRMDFGPDRLAELERQLGVQHDLARKHRAQPEDLQQVLEKLLDRCQRAGSLEQRLAKLQAELDESLRAYREAAASLYARRRQRAKTLSEAVTALMQELGMEGGRFEITVAHDEDGTPSARGSDKLELRVTANPGVPAGLLRKVASGGELSRISLAIKVAAKSGAAAPTQIFDEVDAGVGGDTANAIGALLKSLSADGQSLCVTHLAQVAAFADQQLQVQKMAAGSETRVKTSLLAEEERIDEIARMLGGRLSDQSRAHASELLALASTRH